MFNPSRATLADLPPGKPLQPIGDSCPSWCQKKHRNNIHRAEIGRADAPGRTVTVTVLGSPTWATPVLSLTAESSLWVNPWQCKELIELMDCLNPQVASLMREAVHLLEIGTS